jgi:hypothetical protein
MDCNDLVQDRDHCNALVNTVINSELIGFWTLSIVQYSKKLENKTFRKPDLFPSSGQYWTMDKVQKPINSECYTPSSEPIRIYGNKPSGNIKYWKILE